MVARIRRPEATRCLQEALLTAGWEVTLAEVQDFWEWHSARMDSRWLSFNHALTRSAAASFAELFVSYMAAEHSNALNAIVSHSVFGKKQQQ